MTIRELRYQLAEAEDAITNAYWTYTRAKRGRPPAGELYKRRNAIVAELRRRGARNPTLAVRRPR